MKKIVFGFLIFATSLVVAQRVVIKEIEPLTYFVKGEFSDKLISPNAAPEESKINYEYYGFAALPYQQKINQLIYNYTKKVAFDTVFIPMAEKVSRPFFKDAVLNFFEGYNYLRFQLNVDDLPPFSFQEKITIDTTSLKNYVQLIGSTYAFTGGAHGNYFVTHNVVDKRSGEEISWDKLLKNKEEFTKVAEKYFRKVENLEPTSNFDNYFFDNQKFTLSQQFVFSKKGITLIYQPYEAREWARGFIEVTIPKSKIKKYINFNW